MKYMELEQDVKLWFKNLNPTIKKSFWLSLVLINVAFLFHTVNFMFGDHDWLYVRYANHWDEGSFEGRPLHFVLQSLFFGGHVLPILNNLFSFVALTISGLLLARYWQIPLSTFKYTLFTVFVAVLPLTLVWLFYAKDTLINLSLPLIVIGALSLAELPFSRKYINAHALGLLLFYFAFTSYAAVLNLIGVCLIGRMLIEYANGKSLTSMIKGKIPVAIEILLALLFFKVTLANINLASDYNTKTIPLDILADKLTETILVMFSQFTTPIPFMEYKYKLLLLALCLLGIGSLLYKSKMVKWPLILVLLIAILFSSKLAFFLADERGQELAEMENFAFVPRLDFYGLSYIYALGLALTLTYTSGRWYKICAILGIAVTFMSGVRDMYAQKVWKFGFDAEMKAHERIVGRMEQLPSFRADGKYRILQIGTLSLRKNFYKNVGNEEISLDLLETSFTPKSMSRIVYNFYYPEEIFYNNASIGDLSTYGKELLKKAKVWPLPGSIFIDGDIVVVVLTEEGLEIAKKELQ